MLGPFHYALLRIALGLVGVFLTPDGLYDPGDVSQAKGCAGLTRYLWALGALGGVSLSPGTVPYR